ncbi:MAG: haloacid dehalogenase type II [Gammaproteobacteria bacterium]|nr:haloacid dehalogenase type II [Gammaproteobacteria bacterium]MDH3467179.1 haloacid dehalogenase type II [Gammaproteobacteria bacterium]
MTMPFENIGACVFDAYGTLFDVHSAVGRFRQRLGDRADQVSALWRTKQLEYTWLRSLMGRHEDFWQVTGDALDYALDSNDIEDAELRSSLMDAYLELDCYPEVRTVLESLKEAGIKLAILSNGTPLMLQAAVSGAGLGDVLETILSVEDVGIYKPDPSVYQLAVDRLQMEESRISFQSSNSWDAVGAAAFGFRVAWVNRFKQRRERLPASPDAEISTLAELPALVGVE